MLNPSLLSRARLYLWPWGCVVVTLPVAAALKFAGAADSWVFFACGAAIVPLAGLMGEATEHLAERFGPGIGGLLNATFGNAAELIIALMVLWHGPRLYPLVKASLTGSIIGNLLLVLGLATLVGGLRHPRQVFNRTAASMGTTLLALACVGLLVPTLFFYLYTAGPHPTAGEARNVENLSEEIAVVLAAAYGLGLLFSLRTHKHLFTGAEEAGPTATTGTPGHRWGVGRSLLVLAGATAGVAVLSEWLVGAVEKAAEALGMTPVFVGVIVVAVVGNAAEHSTAVWMAWKNRMGLAVQIAVGSSMQVALFVAPVLVFASMLMGHEHALDLHFTPMEVAATLTAVAVTALVSHDGESNWLEGALLLAVYVIFALAFYHLPAAAE
jgi:Ca2+:H+ antiporter